MAVLNAQTTDNISPESVKEIITLNRGRLRVRRVTTVADIEPFRFMDLPPELRNKVYCYLLKEDEPTAIRTIKARGGARVAVRDKTSYGPVRWRIANGVLVINKPSDLRILGACKQMAVEAGPVAYENEFRFFDISDMRVFLESIGSMRKYVKHISMVNINGWVKNKGPCSFEPLKDAVNLRTLKMPFAMLHQPPCIVRKGDITLQRFARIVERLVKELHEKRQGSAAALRYSVLDIVSFIHRPCTPCENGKDCRRVRSTCKDVAERGDAATKELRSMMAKALKIDEKVEGESA